MRFANAKQFLARPRQSISLIGMSGIGKSTLAAKLPRSRWFHYSGDYRIGTRYMGEAIADNLKAEAMGNPFLAALLRKDAIRISANITIDDLSPLSSYLGKLGDPDRGGLDLATFRARQRQHRSAEILALCDLPHFIDRAERVYGYPHVINDAGGSAVEVIDFDDPNDPVLRCLCDHSLILYIRATEQDLTMLAERAAADPKPLYYCDPFLDAHLPRYLAERGLSDPAEMSPDGFVQWAFPHLLSHRQALYERLGAHGYAVSAADLFRVADERDFLDLIAEAIDAEAIDAATIDAATIDAEQAAAQAADGGCHAD